VSEDQDNPDSSYSVSSQYLGVRAGLAPAQAGNRKGLPLPFEKIPYSLIANARFPNPDGCSLDLFLNKRNRVFPDKMRFSDIIQPLMQPNSSRLIKNPVSKSSLPYWGTTLLVNS
jgi:hypothetical protein